VDGLPQGYDVHPGALMARILVVDDEKDAAFMIKFILEKGGHSVQTASNGEEALLRLGIDPPDPKALLPDLVLLDVMMPVMDGFTVSVHMRQDPRTAALPIVVIAAHGDMRHLFIGAPNVADFVQKPFDPKLLEDAVAKALVGRNPS